MVYIKKKKILKKNASLKKNLKNNHQKTIKGASLVVHWLRIRLPMQGTQVRAPVQEDPTCRRAAEPVCHNY